MGAYGIKTQTGNEWVSNTFICVFNVKNVCACLFHDKTQQMRTMICCIYVCFVDFCIFFLPGVTL